MTHAIAFDESELNSTTTASTITRKLGSREKARQKLQSIDRPLQPSLPRLVCCFSLESDVGIAPSMDLVLISIARASAVSMSTFACRHCA